MILESRFEPGDKAWCIVGGKNVVKLTVGMVRVEYIDSPGTEKGSIFDNYSPCKLRKEEYMCIETGIKSGSIYTLGRNIWATEQEAENKIAEHEQKEVEKLWMGLD